MEHRKTAEELFLSGYNCAQAVFCAFKDVTNVDEVTGLRLMSSFGGGMGKLREVCGACSGAFAVVGLLYGSDNPNDNKAKSEHYALVRRIAEEFKAIHGTYNCGELMTGIANASGENPAIRTPEYYKTRPCCRFVGDAAAILDRIILEKSGMNENK